MSVLNSKFVVRSGDKKTLTFTITDGADGTALDMTGKSLRFVLSKYDASRNTFASPVVTKVSSDSAQITVNDALTSKYDVFLVAADTASLSGLYYYELEVVESGEVVTVARGVIEFEPTIANA